MTRSERLPLAPVDPGRAFKIMCKQRPDELKDGKVEALWIPSLKKRHKVGGCPLQPYLPQETLSVKSTL